MKIKLSKAQWKQIGKTAGWISDKMSDVLAKPKEISKDKVECPYCKKEIYIEKLSNQKGQSLCPYCKKPFQSPSKASLFL